MDLQYAVPMESAKTYQGLMSATPVNRAIKEMERNAKVCVIL